MTGYAAGSFNAGGIAIHVEVKSFNHRFLDVAVKMPRNLGALERLVRRELAAVASRGHIELYVTAEVPVARSLNRRKMRDVHQMLLAVRNDLSLQQDVGFADLFLMREMFTGGVDDAVVTPAFEKRFLAGIRRILRQFVATRKAEGRTIRSDLAARIRTLHLLCDRISSRVPQVRDTQRSRMSRRIEEIFHKDFNLERLEQEIAHMLDKLDVSEELSRLKAHLDAFRRIMESPEPAGKKLDFYTQEIFREINTLSVKSQDVLISELAVEFKAELEKIREQVQNAE